MQTTRSQQPDDVRILVVCTANVARSPLAAAMLDASLSESGLTVGSAGTHARPGHPAAAATQHLGRQRGLDLSEHRSRAVSEDLIRGSHLILTMAEAHRDRCATLVAGAGAKVFTLHEFVHLVQEVDLASAPVEPSLRLSWVVARAHRSRPTTPLGSGPREVSDPIQRPWPSWVEMDATVDGLCASVVTTLGAERAWASADRVPAAPADFSGPARRTAARRSLWLRRRAP